MAYRSKHVPRLLALTNYKFTTQPATAEKCTVLPTKPGGTCDSNFRGLCSNIYFRHPSMYLIVPVIHENKRFSQAIMKMSECDLWPLLLTSLQHVKGHSWWSGSLEPDWFAVPRIRCLDRRFEWLMYASVLLLSGTQSSLQPGFEA